MKPFKIRLGWTRQRERLALFGPDAQIELRPWITGSRVGAVLSIGLGLVLWFAVGEARPFLLGALALGGLIGLVLWWKHR